MSHGSERAGVRAQRPCLDSQAECYTAQVLALNIPPPIGSSLRDALHSANFLGCCQSPASITSTRTGTESLLQGVARTYRQLQAARHIVVGEGVAPPHI